MKCNRKFPLLFLLFLISSAILNAQTTSFQYTVDFGNCDAGFFIFPTRDSGFVTSGRDDDNDFIMKHDQNGTVRWSTHILQDQVQAYHYVEPTMDSGYIALGLTNHLGKNYYQLVKLDTGGNVVWEKHYDVTSLGMLPSSRSYLGLNGNGLEGMRCRQCADSGYVVEGEVCLNNATHYYLVFKTNSQGNVLWSYLYDVGNVLVSDMDISNKSTSLDWIVLSGTVYGDTSKVSLVCIDDIGNLIWSKRYSVTENAGGFAVKFTSDNGIIVTGHTFDSICYSHNGSIGLNVLLLKTDINGNPIFSKGFSFPGASIEFGNSIIQTNDLGYLIGGTRAGGGTLGMDSVDAFMLKSDLNGNVQWTMLYGNNYTKQEIITVKQGYDLSYLGIGYSAAEVYVVKANLLGISGCEEQAITVNEINLVPGVEIIGSRLPVTIALISIPYSIPHPNYFEQYVCSDLAGLNETSTDNFQLYPNPTNTFVTLEFTAAEAEKTIYIYDITGKMIRSINEISNPSVSIDVSDLVPGMYSVRVVTNTGAYSRLLIKE